MVSVIVGNVAEKDFQGPKELNIYESSLIVKSGDYLVLDAIFEHFPEVYDFKFDCAAITEFEDLAKIVGLCDIVTNKQHLRNKANNVTGVVNPRIRMYVNQLLSESEKNTFSDMCHVHARNCIFDQITKGSGAIITIFFEEVLTTEPKSTILDIAEIPESDKKQENVYRCKYNAGIYDIPEMMTILDHFPAIYDVKLNWIGIVDIHRMATYVKICEKHAQKEHEKNQKLDIGLIVNPRVTFMFDFVVAETLRNALLKVCKENGSICVLELNPRKGAKYIRIFFDESRSNKPRLANFERRY